MHYFVIAAAVVLFFGIASVVEPLYVDWQAARRQREERS